MMQYENPVLTVCSSSAGGCEMLSDPSSTAVNGASNLKMVRKESIVKVGFER